jgi:hypothetical protein
MVKCTYCKKKIGVVSFECKCTNKRFCSNCRMPESHECSFDFLKEQQNKLKTTLIKVINNKLIKI